MQLTEEQTRFADAYDWFALPPHPVPDGNGWRVCLAAAIFGPFEEQEEAWTAFENLMIIVRKAKISVSRLHWEDTKTDFERACQAAENGGLKLVANTAMAHPINNHCEADFER